MNEKWYKKKKINVVLQKSYMSLNKSEKKIEKRRKKIRKEDLIPAK